MPFMPRIARLPVLACLAVQAAALAGCGEEKIRVLRYPQFYDADIQTVAVLPFEDKTNDRALGKALADAVAAEMKAQGVYNIVPPDALAAVADANALAAAADLGAILELLRKGEKVQAVVVGEVSQFKDDLWAGGTGDGTQEFTQKAAIDASARLIRVVDGGVMRQSQPGSGSVALTHLPGTRADDEIVAKCAAALAGPFGPTPGEAKIKKNSLFTASALRGKKWQKEDRFVPTGNEVILVVKLPKSCDRCLFRVAIADKTTGQEIAAEDLLWTAQWSEGPGEGFPFPIKDILERARPGRFEARLYSGD
jgi:hypothetical protein